jgi:hypothetical protein
MNYVYKRFCSCYLDGHNSAKSGMLEVTEDGIVAEGMTGLKRMKM